jgi:hypothetical protein
MAPRYTIDSTKKETTSETGNMTVTINDITKAFDDLIEGSKSKEEIAEYATKAMKCDDQGSLKMEPYSESVRIWRAITYLSGVDLMTAPETYFHCTEDFEIFRKEIGV